jgi:hypothetical protein
LRNNESPFLPNFKVHKPKSFWASNAIDIFYLLVCVLFLFFVISQDNKVNAWVLVALFTLALVLRLFIHENRYSGWIIEEENITFLSSPDLFRKSELKLKYKAIKKINFWLSPAYLEVFLGDGSSIKVVQEDNTYLPYVAKHLKSLGIPVFFRSFDAELMAFIKGEIDTYPASLDDIAKSKRDRD